MMRAQAVTINMPQWIYDDYGQKPSEGTEDAVNERILPPFSRAESANRTAQDGQNQINMRNVHD